MSYFSVKSLLEMHILILFLALLHRMKSCYWICAFLQYYDLFYFSVAY